MKVTIMLLGSIKDIANKLAQTPAITISNDLLDSALKEVLLKYNLLGASDQVAKGSSLVAELLIDPIEIGYSRGHGQPHS